mgnify:CR=1 FL=1
MPDFIYRLERPIPGDRFHVERPVMEEAKRRTAKKAKKELIKPHREPKPHKIRNTYNTVRPEPYAPQLIRLRRNPYPLYPGYFRKMEGGKRAKIEPKLRDRPNVGELVESSRREPRLAFPKPTDCRIRLEARPRPSVDAWLNGGDR